MLNVICKKEGIVPSTLTGYEPLHSTLPSMQLFSSASGPMEWLWLSETLSEPLHKLGE